MTTPDEVAAELAHKSLSTGDVAGWFEPLYAAAAQGDAVVPWDRGEPHPMLVDWATGQAAAGNAVETEGIARASTATLGRALVAGCGPGHDAEYLAALGYDTTAFDVSPTAIADVQRRHPDTTVDYRVANLFELPTDWHGAFDLVVEVMTVQAMPRTVRADAIAAIRPLVVPGGTLIVIGMHLPDDWPPEQGPPWPLTLDELELFATDGLHGQLVSIPREDGPDTYRYTLTRNTDVQEGPTGRTR